MWYCPYFGAVLVRLEIYTIPIAISTSRVTMTTMAEMIKPWIIGRMPAFFMLEKEVFRPMAARAQTIRNLLAVFVPDTTAIGIGNTLTTKDMARKPRKNRGKIFTISFIPMRR